MQDRLAAQRPFGQMALLRGSLGADAGLVGAALYEAEPELGMSAVGGDTDHGQ